MATDYELTITDYILMLRRRASYLIGIFVVCMLVAVILTFTIPRTYRSTGTVLVESQQIADNVLPGDVQDKLGQRLEEIKVRVLTRENLIDLANKYDLFKNKLDSNTPEDLIDKIRDRINIETINSREVRSNSPAIAFTISFDDKHPDVSLEMTKELINLFLDWNVKLRTDQAEETTDFLSQESQRLKADVDKMEDKIAAYKRQNGNALPEQLNLRESMMQRSENDLYSVDRDIRSGQEELRSLQAELAAAQHGMSDDPAQTLPALKAEYTKLRAIYTDDHPDVIAVKNKIAALEKSDSSGAASVTDSPSTVTNLTVYKIQAKVDAVNASLESLASQKKMLQEKISENEHSMELTPRVAQGLEVLLRDRDTAQKKYEEIMNKKMTAKISENLESENKSGRFTVLEPPLLPTKPFKPNRLKILAAGFFVSLLASFGAIMLLETIDKRVRGAEALAHIIGHRPLAVIPYLKNAKLADSNKYDVFMNTIRNEYSKLAESNKYFALVKTIGNRYTKFAESSRYFALMRTIRAQIWPK